MNAYWRAANYLSVGQVYLRDNAMLERPLPLGDKPRLLGHWGTTPGLNFLYVHLNRLIVEHELDMINVIGPGHGGPRLVANTYLEGSYTERYPAIERSRSGMHRLFRQFRGQVAFQATWHRKRPDRSTKEASSAIRSCTPTVPRSTILISSSPVSSATARPRRARWPRAGISNKFLDPARDGAVLPILHLNGFKIANPMILARIAPGDLDALLRG